MEMTKNEQTKVETPQLPCGAFCGHNCADGCIYWDPHDRDFNNRQWCNWYSTYYYPHERQGCLSYQE